MKDSRLEISKREKGCRSVKSDERVLVLLEKSRLNAREVRT